MTDEPMNDDELRALLERDAQGKIESHRARKTRRDARSRDAQITLVGLDAVLAFVLNLWGFDLRDAVLIALVPLVLVMYVDLYRLSRRVDDLRDPEPKPFTDEDWRDLQAWRRPGGEPE